MDNSITDVAGVFVGHKTLINDDIQTGVTAIIPKRNIFREKIRANGYVFNGYAKCIGLTQILELHTIETPILLTNTLSAPFAAAALNEIMIEAYPEIGRSCTVNPVVLECNDNYLNNNRKQSLKKQDVAEALHAAGKTFELGSVGAGRGMSCYQLKGGIGTSSQKISIKNTDYVIGALTLCNMGRINDLIYLGNKIDERLKEALKLRAAKDKGSIIMVIATDLPLSDTQLKRVSKRAVMGLSKTGTYGGHGSGDIVLTFTTDSPQTDDDIHTIYALNDKYLDAVFKTTHDVVVQSIYSSLEHSTSVTSFNTRVNIKDALQNS